MFIEALFTIAKQWKQPKCSSIDKWIKRCGVYTTEGFPSGSVIKNPPANSGDIGTIPESGRYPGEEKAIHFSSLAWKKSHGQRSLAGYSSNNHKSQM